MRMLFLGLFSFLTARSDFSSKGAASHIWPAPTFVINLQRRGERRRSMAQRLKPYRKWLYPVMFVNATDAAALSDRDRAAPDGGLDILLNRAVEANRAAFPRRPHVWERYSLGSPHARDRKPRAADWTFWDRYTEHDKAELHGWHTRGLKLGEVGCAISHYRAWHAASSASLRTGASMAIVLEDDVQITGGVNAWTQLIAQLAQYERMHRGDASAHDHTAGTQNISSSSQGASWDLLLLGRRARFDLGLRDGVGDETGSPHRGIGRSFLRPAGYSWGAFAYALSARGLAKLLDPIQCGGVHTAAARVGVQPHGAAPRRPVLAFDQLLMPVDEFLPALFTASPRTDLAALAGHLPRLTALAWVPPLHLHVVRHVHDGFSDTEYSHYVHHVQANSTAETSITPGGKALALVTGVPTAMNSSTSSESAHSPSRAFRSERRAKLRARHARVRSQNEDKI